MPDHDVTQAIRVLKRNRIPLSELVQDLYGFDINEWIQRITSKDPVCDDSCYATCFFCSESFNCGGSEHKSDCLFIQARNLAENISGV